MVVATRDEQSIASFDRVVLEGSLFEQGILVYVCKKKKKSDFF